MKRVLTIFSVVAGLAHASLALAEAPDAHKAGGVEKPSTYAMVDVDLFLPDDNSVQDITGLLVHPFSRNFGLLVFARSTGEQLEAYTGPALLVGPLKIGGGVGLETDESPVRYGAAGILLTKRLNISGHVDAGGSGLRWTAKALWRPRKWLAFGPMAQNGDGIGPRMEIIPLGKILSLHFAFMKPEWGVPGYSSLIGLHLETD